MESSKAQAEKTRRGFNAMDAGKQKEIASKGGRAAHEQGVAHKWSSKEAAEAGKKGVQAKKRDNNGNKPLL